MGKDLIKNYIKNRLNDQIIYYNNKSIKYKKYYYTWQVISIISSASIPVLAGLASYSHWIVLIISILGALAGTIQSILSLTKIRSNWLLYRFIAEKLKTQKIKFHNACNPYDDESIESNFHLLVNQCESIMSSEHDEWFSKNNRK